MTGPVGGHVGHVNAAANVALLGIRKDGKKRNTGPGLGTTKNPVYGDRIRTLLTVVKETTIGLVA